MNPIFKEWISDLDPSMRDIAAVVTERILFRSFVTPLSSIFHEDEMGIDLNSFELPIDEAVKWGFELG